jgi:hypothetical protein
MRDDMSKVITECYREKYSTRSNNLRTERRRVRQKLQEAIFFEEEHLDEILEEESAIKTKAPIKNFRHFDFGENLSPLQNFIQSSLDKSYDEVYSEMKAAIPDGTMGDHVLQHFHQYFDHNMRLDDEGYLIHPDNSFAKSRSGKYYFNFYYLENDKIIRNYKNKEHKLKVGNYEGYMRNDCNFIPSENGTTIGRYDKMLPKRDKYAWDGSRYSKSAYESMKFELYSSMEFVEKNRIQLPKLESHFDSGFYLVVFRPYFGHERIAQYEVYHFSKDDYFSGESRYTNKIAFRSDHSSGLYNFPFVRESDRDPCTKIRYFVKIRHMDASEYADENKEFLARIKKMQEKIREDQRKIQIENRKKEKKRKLSEEKFTEALRNANFQKKMRKIQEKEATKNKEE